MENDPVFKRSIDDKYLLSYIALSEKKLSIQVWQINCVHIDNINFAKTQ